MDTLRHSFDVMAGGNATAILCQIGSLGIKGTTCNLEQLQPIGLVDVTKQSSCLFSIHQPVLIGGCTKFKYECGTSATTNKSMMLSWSRASCDHIGILAWDLPMPGPHFVSYLSPKIFPFSFLCFYQAASIITPRCVRNSFVEHSQIGSSLFC